MCSILRLLWPAHVTKRLLHIMSTKGIVKCNLTKEQKPSMRKRKMVKLFYFIHYYYYFFLFILTNLSLIHYQFNRYQKNNIEWSQNVNIEQNQTFVTLLLKIMIALKWIYNINKILHHLHLIKTIIMLIIR